ncbi:MAG: iron-sulfur cluster assembly scaffold protein [Sphaerochaetaceae bacterium]|jgi:nitrogen fixation NifU-like protein|nr:iron-sulfur cluster assembly scaffold protein [Sphaerochaetaceae bacterium]NLO60375.1 iron-sulfur cluster assembly scaffold protein [Spirochaetales bacterium]MDD2406239.1 iron-sulfur cluster assembly scaffold protein [Sphaerochaetaceae bacterium]MDD3671622.1 iron-sulfur cluster assembly scaffold protein [Sphaerochaetaceae bacterium]MDD4258785.1 iron-sulfur cluster assembly scaffold protein [Sphaerochaetaceae bacterium]
MSGFTNDWVYSDTVKEHFMNPKNLWDDDSFQYDGFGQVGSLACGDQMRVGIQVRDDKIVDLRWQTYGCASAIASTSMMSVMVIGMTLEEAYNLTPAMITERLGGLPQHKFHCSVLGDKALRAAIDDYLDKQGRDNPYRRRVAKVICECKGITDHRIEELVKTKQATTIDELREITQFGTVCGKCRYKVHQLFEEYKHIYNV